MDTLDQILDNLWTSDYVQKNPNKAYKAQYNDEYLAIASYINGGTRPNPTSYSKMGKVLVGLEDQKRAVVVEPPSTGATPFFVSDWRTGKVGYKVGEFDKGQPWSTIFSYTAPGYQDCGLYGGAPKQASPDGRVSVVDNPYGSGKVLRCEIRDSDPGLSGAPNLSKSEVGSYKTVMWPNGYKPGGELWVKTEVYLPDEFGFATGGANPFTLIMDLHPSSNSGISALELANYPGSYIQLHCGISPSQRINFIPLDAAHRNRKLDILLGAKLDQNGWVEAWLDGVNVIPRKNMAMVEASESGPYWKQGLYTYADASFPGGKCVVYHGKTEIFRSKP